MLYSSLFCLELLPKLSQALCGFSFHVGAICCWGAAACLLAGTLKCHGVVPINMTIAGTSTMRLESQKAKEWAGSSHQSHGFNPFYIVLQIKDSNGQKKRDIQ